MKKSKGFTLIELMIVVAIIGILAAIAIPKFADLIRKSQEGATKGNLGAIRSAISIYYGENEGWFPVPSTGNSLDTVLTMQSGKYIDACGPSRQPPYHNSGSSFTYTGVLTGDNGNWGYQNNRTPAVSDTEGWGELWVNCTHTDSKLAAWTTY